MANSVVGLGLASPPVQLSNTVNAISQKFIVPILGDNVFKPSPVFWALTREGKRFGAGELIFPEIYQEELPGGAYYGDQLLDTSVVDSVQPANQQWKPYRQPVVIPITDIILNRGGSNNLDIIRAKFQTASGSFLVKLSRALWHTSPQNTSLDVDDLNSWVLSTTNTIAGINRASSANAWWLPATVVAGTGALGSATALAEPGYQSVTWGYDEPDLFVMNRTSYAAFKRQLHFVDSLRPGDAGRRSLAGRFPQPLPVQQRGHGRRLFCDGQPGHAAELEVHLPGVPRGGLLQRRSVPQAEQPARSGFVYVPDMEPELYLAQNERCIHRHHVEPSREE
jgi:hypothetical protein